MTISCNPRIAGLEPSVVRIKSTQTLSNEQTVEILNNFLTSAKDALALATSSALQTTISTGDEHTQSFDNTATQFSRYERSVAQLTKLEKTLHDYHTEFSVDQDDVDMVDVEDAPEETEPAAKKIDKEERKRLKKERKKAQRQERQEKSQDA